MAQAHWLIIFGQWGAAARRFLDRVGHWQEDDYAGAGSWGHYRSWEFLDALGQMRGIFGVHIAMIAARYGLEVKGDLEAILPVETREDEFKTEIGRIS